MLQFCFQGLSISILRSIIVLFILVSPLYGFDEQSYKKLFQECITRNCVSGTGTMIYYSTQKYVGGFKDGQGTMIYPDDRVYAAEFREGKRTGYGTITHPDGRIITGRFSDGKYVGPAH